MLDGFGRLHKGILRQSAYGSTFEEQVGADGRSAGYKAVRPVEVFEDFVHGRYIHGDPDKRARVEAWTGFHKWALLDAASSLTEFYTRFAAGPLMILRETRLHV